MSQEGQRPNGQIPTRGMPATPKRGASWLTGWLAGSLFSFFARSPGSDWLHVGTFLVTWAGSPGSSMNLQRKNVKKQHSRVQQQPSFSFSFSHSVSVLVCLSVLSAPRWPAPLPLSFACSFFAGQKREVQQRQFRFGSQHTARARLSLPRQLVRGLGRIVSPLSSRLLRAGSLVHSHTHPLPSIISFRTAPPFFGAHRAGHGFTFGPPSSHLHERSGSALSLGSAPGRLFRIAHYPRGSLDHHP